MIVVKVSDREEVEERGKRGEREHVKRERFIPRVAASLADKDEPMMLVSTQNEKVSSTTYAGSKQETALAADLWALIGLPCGQAANTHADLLWEEMSLCDGQYRWRSPVKYAERVLD